MPATLYIGAPGSGKTSLMRAHVHEILAAAPESVILIVDHGERPGRPTWLDLPGARAFRSAREWWHDPARVAVFQGCAGREIAQLAIDVGWTLYVDDECDDVVSDGWRDSPLREIAKRGRHLGNAAGDVTAVQALLATHRPANLPTDLSGLFDRVYVGRLYAWRDCERIHREAWIQGCRTPGDVQAVLAELAPAEPDAPGERRFLWWP